MSTSVMKMSKNEASKVASSFVPLGKEKQAGIDISSGTLAVDVSIQTPENITPFQAWARHVCIEHPNRLLSMGLTKSGRNYLEFMSDMALKGLWAPPQGETLAMLKRVHSECTFEADIKWEAV